MSPEPVATERTYQSLKRDIVTGVHRPGVLLNLQRLADEFGTSVSPVRDALHRLVGDRLLELHPGGGFRCPIPTVEQLHDLYQWHDLLIRQALRSPLTGDQKSRIAALGISDGTPETLAQLASDLFRLLGSAARSVEFSHAIDSASDRLSIARMHEPDVMRHVVREIESILLVAVNGSLATIRHAVWEYHRRRLRRVPRIASAISLASS